jgi:hypothetical protein
VQQFGDEKAAQRKEYEHGDLPKGEPPDMNSVREEHGHPRQASDAVEHRLMAKLAKVLSHRLGGRIWGRPCQAALRVVGLSPRTTRQKKGDDGHDFSICPATLWRLWEAPKSAISLWKEMSTGWDCGGAVLG